MKKLLTTFALLLVGVSAFSQQNVRELDEINEDNSWLKLGVNMGVPVGDISNYSSFAFGLDAAGQFMRTDNFGLGVASGYTQYFKKSDVAGAEDFGVIPLGAMFRYYPQPAGVFVGTDLGYSFYTGSGMSESGAAYIRPQVGYHNYDWNIFGFYNHAFTSDPGMDVQAVGVAVTYNIRFK
ncbi:hypothetical protein [Algoriphagus vanfongensis]|uniref:hypothetical protein n=1 Tax=Algoriphagus vanfongensis TaxID=426371 RepID=UPI0003FB08BC|nr:hypothetical protein [Algoriphagus vanfongensis]